jgi:hypothetical protein
LQKEKDCEFLEFIVNAATLLIVALFVAGVIGLIVGWLL